MSLFLVSGRCPISQEPTAEFLQASRDTLTALGEAQAAGLVKGGGVMIGPLGVVFILDGVDNEQLHVFLTTLASFRFAEWEVTPLIAFHRDIEMTLDDALTRAHP